MLIPFYSTAGTMQFARWLLAALVALALIPSAHAGDVIAGIKARGTLRCGVSEGIAGFSEQDKAGRWSGLDADFCRAVAAARVRRLPRRSSSCRSRRPRVSLRCRPAASTCWCATPAGHLSREAAFNVQFPAVLFYDGQGFMVPRRRSIAGAADLQGATVCVEKGTTHVANLAEYAEASGLSFTPLVIDSRERGGRGVFCRPLQGLHLGCLPTRRRAPARSRRSGGPEPLRYCPSASPRNRWRRWCWAGIQQWATLVRWVLFTLILAEETGRHARQRGARSGRRSSSGNSNSGSWRVATKLTTGT